MSVSQKLYKVKGVVQHYSWGGYDFIPQLLGITNSSHKPFAEYWLGAHPNHTASLQNESDHSLKEYISNQPAVTLGEKVAKKFASLPYLLKVLDVRQMLSIQVHPSKSSAEEGYQKENQLGIPVTAAHRNYKDENHKPELMVALSDFWLLHGFKSEPDLTRLLKQVPELEFLLPIFKERGYKGLYEDVMMMDQAMVNEILEPLVKRITILYEEGRLKKDQEDFWAARAVATFCKNGNLDRGIFSVYLFNLLHLKKGEGIFQPAGMPHAYLEGENVEVMANSDNVLRAGLTDKHIDVSELLKHVLFEPTIPTILRPDDQTSHTVFASPAEEFELHEYRLANDAKTTVTTQTGELFLVADGNIEAAVADNKLDLKRGEAFFAGPATTFWMTGRDAQVFRVTVPVDK